MQFSFSLVLASRALMMSTCVTHFTDFFTLFLKDKKTNARAKLRNANRKKNTKRCIMSIEWWKNKQLLLNSFWHTEKANDECRRSGNRSREKKQHVQNKSQEQASVEHKKTAFAHTKQINKKLNVNIIYLESRKKEWRSIDNCFLSLSFSSVPFAVCDAA